MNVAFSNGNPIKTYVIECEKCYSLLEYQYDDIKYFPGEIFIICPVCGEKIIHNEENVMLKEYNI